MTELMTIIAQAFYGNRTLTHIVRDDLPYFLCVIMDKAFYNSEYNEPLDETIIELPVKGTALVYNKYAEEKAKNDTEYTKPLASIPELNLTLLSRCILCGIDDSGNLISITPEKCKEAIKYLSL